MKLLVVLGSDEIFSLIEENIEPLGFDLIRYRTVLKAMDNVEEIGPVAIIVSARDFPRHWKIMVQFVRFYRSKAECPIFLLKGPNFFLEDAIKAFYLGVSGIVSEDLTRPSEVDQLQRLLRRYISLEDKRRSSRYHLEGSGDVGICIINPVTKSLITGGITTLSSTGIAFIPTDALPDLKKNTEIAQCSLRIGKDYITPICRTVRIGPEDMSMEFIFLHDMDRILLDTYLDALPQLLAASSPGLPAGLPAALSAAEFPAEEPAVLQAE